MALFGSKQKKATPVVAEKKQAVEKTDTSSSAPIFQDVFDVLRSPRITEKATDSIERNVYVFMVKERATKNQIKEAVRKFYSVDPVKVHTATVQPKARTRKGITGHSASGKKAYIYLKKGQTIEII